MPRDVLLAESRPRQPLLRRAVPWLGALLLVALPLTSTAGEPAAGEPAAGEPAHRAVELHKTSQGTALDLAAGLAPSWREVNVGRLVVQTPAGQRRLDLGLPTKSRRMMVDLHEANDACALLLAELGPPSAQGHADSWRRITQVSKVVVCPEGTSLDALEARRRAGAALTVKSGSLIELRAMTNPATARPGSDLAVSAYLEGSAQSGVTVTALGPDGAELTAVTGPTGVAVFRIPTAGDWNLSFSAPLDGEDLTASLSFDVLDDAAWQPLLGGAQQ